MAISHAAETKSSSAYSVGLQPAISNPQSVQTFTDNRSIESSDGLVLQEKADDKAVSSSGPTVQFDSGSAGDDDVKSTGGGDLPPDLQAGIESLSGISMDDVKVHENSDAPEQLGAHAYAQGNDIHLGPGQEKHLPHEAWHVVQQMQGRVQPTTQLKGIVPVNDDKGLEREADVMGAKAVQNNGIVKTKSSTLSFPTSLQRKVDSDFEVVQGAFWNSLKNLLGLGKTGDDEEQSNSTGTKEPAVKPTVDELSAADKTNKEYKYEILYWVTETETLRKIDSTKKATAGNKNAETILTTGKTNPREGVLDKFKGLFGFGEKQKDLRGKKLNPGEQKIFIPVKVDESSKISSNWKPVKVQKNHDLTADEGLKEKYSKLEETEGFFPKSHMVAMPYDFNSFKKSQIASKNAKTELGNTNENPVLTGTESNQVTTNQDNTNQPESDNSDVNIVEEAASITTIESPENNAQEVDEILAENKTNPENTYKKYGKKLFRYATQYSSVRVIVNKQLQKGGDILNDLSSKAKEKAKDIEFLNSLRLNTKAEGNRVIKEGITFNFGAEMDFLGAKRSLNVQLFTETTNYTTKYLGSYVKPGPITIGDPSSGPFFNADLGMLTHEFSDESSYITSRNGDSKLKWDDTELDIKWNSLSFSPKSSEKFKANLKETSFKATIFENELTFTLTNPDIVDKKLKFDEAKAELTEFEPFSNFKIGPTTVTLKSKEAKYDITGETGFKYEKDPISNASGNIKISRIDGKYNAQLSEGRAKLHFNNVDVDISNISYDYQKEKYTIKASKLETKIKLKNPTDSSEIEAEGFIVAPKISEEGFNYTALSFKSKEGFSLFNKIKIKNIRFSAIGADSYKGSASFGTADKKEIEEASGNLKVSGSFKADRAETKYSLTDGNLKVKFGEQSISVDGVKYNSKSPQEIKAKKADAKFDIPNPTSEERIKAEGVIRSPKVTKDGFRYLVGSFESKEGVNFFDEFNLKNIYFQVIPGGKYLNGKASFALSDNASVVKNANGLLSIAGSYEKGDEINFSLRNGDFGVAILGQEISISGVKYDSAVNKDLISAESSVLKLNFNNPLGDDNIAGTGSIQTPTVSSSGFGFTSANLHNDEPINLFQGLNFDNINVDIKPKGEYDGKGKFKAVEGGIIKDASGDVGISHTGNDDSKTQYKLNN